jgi:hypothetical protein
MSSFQPFNKKKHKYGSNEHSAGEQKDTKDIATLALR